MKTNVYAVNTEYRPDSGGDYYVSYNPDCTMQGDGSETALVYGDKYYILLGDWREEYYKVIEKGFDECIKVFLNNIEHKSMWSNEYDR